MKFKLISSINQLDDIRNAIRLQDAGKVQEIIDSGFDVNSSNNIGDTPIIMATLFGTPEIVKILLDAGADPTIKGGTGRSAIEYAKDLGKKELINLFENNRGLDIKFKIKSNKFTKELIDTFDLSKEEFSKIDRGLSAISNYGLIHSDELEELADEIGMDVIKLQDIALELGYNVE